MISIVLPTYNRKEKLKKCLESILDQTYNDFELVVVDDGSTDGTDELFNNISDPRVRYFKLEKNSGAYQARNVGIKEMKGDYFLTWDSDDELFPNALSELMSVINKNPEIDMLCAPGNFYENGVLKVIKERVTGPVTYQEHLASKLPENEVLILVKKSLIGETDLFLGPNIDFSFYLRLSKKAKKVYHYNKLLSNIYLLSDELSETMKRRIPNINKSIARTVGLEILLNDLGDDLEKVAPGKFSGISYGLAVGLLLKGEKIKAIKYGLRGSKYHRKYLLFTLFAFLPFSPAMLRGLFNLKRLLLKK